MGWINETNYYKWQIFTSSNNKVERYAREIIAELNKAIPAGSNNDGCPSRNRKCASLSEYQSNKNRKIQKSAMGTYFFSVVCA